MTPGRPRRFETPVENYVYYQHRGADYSVGVECPDSEESGFLIASREKAIHDKALVDRRFTGTGIPEYLIDDMRIDEDCLNGLNRSILTDLQKTTGGILRWNGFADFAKVVRLITRKRSKRVYFLNEFYGFVKGKTNVS
ncbi:MAG: hypothetical protein PHQ75_12205 [Thermoguttaceae bacterium]|nr:hypothetical protein [Thermoguttaceae bacterium]